jgi:hypothetical protein
MERRAFGVQSIICIYCKKKNNSAFKCLVSRVIRRVPSLAGRLREAEYESLGMLSATLTLGLFQVCPSSVQDPFIGHVRSRLIRSERRSNASDERPCE